MHNHQLSVAHVLPELSVLAGGVSVAVRGLVSGLISNDVQAKIFCGDLDDEFRAQCEDGEIPLEVTKFIGPKSFSYMPKLLSEIENFGPQIVHFHGLWMYPSTVSIKLNQKGIRHVVSPHGMLQPWARARSYIKKSLALMLFEKGNLERASALYALNSDEKADVRDFGYKGRVEVFPNGVDKISDEKLELINLERYERQKEKAKKSLLFLGRIHPKKGLKELILAWAKCRDSAPAKTDDWRLTICGWDEVGFQLELERLAEKLEIDHLVDWVGPVIGSKKDTQLEKADGFILPSYSEGLPIAVLEAWAHSLPVLKTRECNIHEAFDLGAAMEITTDPTEMARKIEEFINKPADARRAMGKSGLRLVEDRFDWASIAENMAVTYQNILKAQQL